MFGVYVTNPDLIVRLLELVSKESDVDFIKYLVTEQGVDVKGKPFVYTKTWCIRVLFLSIRKLKRTRGVVTRSPVTVSRSHLCVL